MNIDFIIISGPSGCGKSATALRFCEAMRNKNTYCEIINADSIAVYRGFNIGAAKPSIADQKLIPHHLLDISSTEQNFTAGDFVREAEKILIQLKKNKILPVIVGGTGFYLRALIQGMTEQNETAAEQKSQIKKALYERLQTEGLPTLYQEMLAKDPALKAKIHAHDQYRILRALEAMQMTGQSWSHLNEITRKAEPKHKNIKYFCLNIPKEELKKRIQFRTQKMLEEGLLKEVQALLASGISPKCKPMQSIGYKECLEYLGLQEPLANSKRPSTEKELCEKISHETCKLAKRQMTWFRGERNIIWLDSQTGDFVEQILLTLN